MYKRQVLRSRPFLVPAAIVSLGSITLFAYIASSPAVLMESYGLTPQQFAFAFGGISLAIVIGSQINIRLLRRYAVHRLLRVYLTLQVCMALILVALTVTSAPVSFIIGGLAVLVMFFAGTQANAVTEALRSFPHLAGTASAALGVGQFVFGAVISIVLAQARVYPPLIMAATMAAASVMALVVAVMGAKSLVDAGSH